MNSPALTFFAYFSRVDCAPEEIDTLVRKSAEKNASCKLTGALVCDGAHFLQFLEGPETASASTILRILSDGRHDEIAVLTCERTQTRIFSNWHMKRISLSDRRGAISEEVARIAKAPRSARSLLLQGFALSFEN